MLKYKATD